MTTRLAVIAAIVVAGPWPAAWADCVSDAARYHSVNELILRAILWNESGMKASAVNRNGNGTVDVGIAQINSIHFRTLSDHGVQPGHLLNPCVGSYVAGWHLRKQVLQYGNTWQAVGAYHSATPYFNQLYANRVHTTLTKWKAVPAGPSPFPVVAPPPQADAAALAGGSSSRGTAAPNGVASPLTALSAD